MRGGLRYGKVWALSLVVTLFYLFVGLALRYPVLNAAIPYPVTSSTI
jgi:hypothetical protein